MNIKCSKIGYGCWQIANERWGYISEKTAMRSINTAIDYGINIFDTADAYGAGYSEKILGRSIGSRRNEIYLSTKVGRVVQSDGTRTINCSKGYIFKAIDSSLKRLSTDFIDFYQLHAYDPNTKLEDTASALLTLKKNGKIRYIGCSNFSIDKFLELSKMIHIDFIQIEFNALEIEDYKRCINVCEQNGTLIMAHSALCRGLLGGKINKDTSFSDKDIRSTDERFYGEKYNSYLRKVKLLNKIAKKLDISLKRLSINFVNSHSQVLTALIGMRNPSQVKENCIDKKHFQLNEKVFKQIYEIAENNFMEIKQ